MAGMLTVVNPRRKRSRRRRSHKARTHKRRRLPNPFMNARRHHTRHRRPNVRRHHRRRHPNPFGGGIATTVMQAGSVFIGWKVTEISVNAVNNYLLKATPLTGLAKTAAKGAMGLVVLPMLAGFIPGGRGFKKSLMWGGVIAVAQDLWAQWVTPALPAELQGYGEEQISGYGTEQISGGPAETGIYNSIY